jgi:membrane-associated phospholipid phosphatase
MNSSIKFNLYLSGFFLTLLFLLLLSGANKSLFLQINSSASALGPFLWSNLTFLGNALPAATLILLFIRKPDIVQAAILGSVMASLLSNVIKYFAGVVRPAGVLDPDIINIIGPVLIHRSFPSGHTITIFTLTGLLFYYFRSMYVRIGLILLALLVGISRIAVGVHWPSDVLAGAAIGSMSAATGIYLARKWQVKRIRTLQITLGIALILADLFLLFFFDSGYPLAICFQYIFAAFVLVVGGREFYYLWKIELDHFDGDKIL